jgi:proteasome lid subunit RPN8/RPN11
VLSIPAGAAAELAAQAHACYPREACGFLVGGRDGARATVSSVQPAENRAESDDRFRIDAIDVFEAQRAARAADEELIGVFHSHPDRDARPSGTDVEDAWGGWLHLIVSCEAGEATEMRCWEWDGSTFVPVHIEETPA